MVDKGLHGGRRIFLHWVCFSLRIYSGEGTEDAAYFKYNERRTRGNEDMGKSTILEIQKSACSFLNKEGMVETGDPPDLSGNETEVSA